MLDVRTRQRIDTARDILVGKVPDPKSQVEQITLALMYKFMDDMDAQSEGFGGNASFFVGEFGRYSWRKVVGRGIGAFDALNLYSEGITRMGENPGLPGLFRSIFNNAYLPFRDPETLRAFLGVIDEFEYDNSERLGDAFEYLLSIMGSQGDAGQFRTPRHIIDFIVEIVDPKKDDVILDPACGTAGFLISAYKHVVGGGNYMDGGDGRDGVALSGEARSNGEAVLSGVERERLARNVRGYDISPDMVRLSLVNLYLHGFPDPDIFEYDALTSEERWSEYANVILANPPFMSPKGGIRPHNRFSVTSKRSEVLFVDYIAEHLTPDGRAGVIVPEGIIFQSQNAHKSLRKMLVEDYLVAVVSLPPGVFNPYSGVKTSVLILDKSLARRSNTIGFFKVEADGFDLGAQRREIDRNDLPAVKGEVKEYLRLVRGGIYMDEREGGDVSCEFETGLVVEKERIGADGEFNLSGERYRQTAVSSTKYPIVQLGEVAEIIAGQSPPGTSYNSDGNGAAFYQGKTEFGEMFIGSAAKWTTDPRRFADETDVLMSVRAPVGPVNLTADRICIGRGLCAIRPETGRLLKQFLFHVLRHLEPDISGNTGTAFSSINVRDIKSIEFPVLPLEVQREIVSEIGGYQKVIDGARAVVENWRPRIAVDPGWPVVELGANGLFEVISGGTPKSNVKNYWDGGVPWITLVDLPADDTITEITATARTISEEGLRKSAARMIPANSVVVSSRATIGRIGINRLPLSTNQGFKNVVIKDPERAIPEYVAVALTELVPEMEANASGSTYKEIIKSRFSRLRIPLPPLSDQQALVAEVQAEREMVEGNRRLIEVMERKVRDAVGRVWRD